MKKKLLSVLLSTAMVAALLAGCTKTPGTSEVTSNTPGSEVVSGNVETGNTALAAFKSAVEEKYPELKEGTEVPLVDDGNYSATDGGKEIVIYCWNDEFQSRVKDHCKDYKADASDPNKGTYKGVDVKWVITPNEGNAYQNKVDSYFLGTDTAEGTLDIFLVEADYAIKYTGQSATLPMSEIGLDDSVFADQFDYTKDAVTFDGKLKGASWQACAGGLIYNRDIATEVLGSDDPAEVQKAVKDWATFNDTAAKLKDAGYTIVSSVNDTYRVYSNNVTSPWVVDGKLNIDANLMNWVNDSKAMVDNGYAGTHDLWSEDWNKGFFEGNGVFSYFGPAWLINFCMAADQDGSVAKAGKWGICEGPQGFFWGGTWVCAANGTDNKTEVAELIKTMTTDKAVLKEIVEKDSDCVNSKSLLGELANDATFGNAILGGQNPYKIFLDGVSKVSLKNIGQYDQGCNEEFQKAMKEYFLGNAELGSLE